MEVPWYRGKKGDGKKGDSKKGDGAVEGEVKEKPPPQYRWILQPKEERQIDVVFTAQHVGQFDSTLGFEVVGDPRSYTLLCRGTCTVPAIN